MGGTPVYGVSERLVFSLAGCLGLCKVIIEITLSQCLMPALAALNDVCRIVADDDAVLVAVASRAIFQLGNESSVFVLDATAIAHNLNGFGIAHFL